MTAKKSAAGAKKIETLNETEAKLWKGMLKRAGDPNQKIGTIFWSLAARSTG
jgi:hypothetical protein